MSETRWQKFLRIYGPNTHKMGLAIIALRQNGRPHLNAYWPMRFRQIVGGKRWSLSLCVYETPDPIPTTKEDFK